MKVACWESAGRTPACWRKPPQRAVLRMLPPAEWPIRVRFVEGELRRGVLVWGGGVEFEFPV